ncbi:MAG TPA: hypothetical protein PLT64_05900 [Syntrophales bacterium]|nr:hypothetical protein [Syntrophales bacterium]
MTAGSLKLVTLIETHAEAIAEQWAKDVKKNARTPSYHSLSDETLLTMATRFYDNFSQMFYTEKPAEISRPYFHQYAEEHFRHNIPLSESLYALILMRRHIWLYAEFQTIFISAVEQKQAVDSLVRTILMFDYAIIFISQRYEELIRGEIERKMGRLRRIFSEGKWAQKMRAHRSSIVMILTLLMMALTTYAHSALQSDILFTHLYYIPIVLGAIWWKRAGIYLAILLSIYLILSHALFLSSVPLYTDLIRSVIFIAISLVVTWLGRGLVAAEEILKRSLVKGVDQP